MVVSPTSNDSRSDSGPHRVYCAGPLFNQAERDEMTAIADLLREAGYLVYLPHRDGMEFRHIHHVLMRDGWAPPVAAHFLHEAIFALDIFQLVEACDSVVWNLNGRTPDEGAVSEAAIAWTLGKPLVAYKEDVRSLITGRDNPLLVGMVGFRTLTEMSAIPPALQEAIGRTNCQPTPLDRLAPALQTAVRQGRELWSVMQDEGAPGDNELIAAVVTELFGGEERPEGVQRALPTTQKIRVD
jgi:nucleoside 2-deoxyribosyltransferase